MSEVALVEEAGMRLGRRLAVGWVEDVSADQARPADAGLPAAAAREPEVEADRAQRAARRRDERVAPASERSAR